MSKELQHQRIAIRNVLKDKQRELVKANESNNPEWIQDVNFDIEHLTKALDTIKDFESLLRILGRE
jgi:hypothetical protein